MKTKIFFIIISCIFVWSASAQTYTLQECKDMALENNCKMKNSRLDKDIAVQTRKQAFTNYFPSVSAMGLAYNASRGMAQMDMTLPMVGTLPISMFKNGKVATVSAVQPVFAGGQIINGNKLARVGAEVSEYQLKLSENEVLETTEKYFWQIVALQEKLNTISVVENQLGKIYEDVQVAVDAGVTTRNDLLKVELQQQGIESDRLKVENGLSITKMLLRQYTGIDNEHFEVSTSEFVSPSSPVDIYMSPDEAVTRRAEYGLLEKNVEATKLQKRMTLGKNLPSVGIGGGYMYHDMTGQDNNFGVVFASVSIPISAWWGGAHDIKKDKLKMMQAENERQQSIELMEVEVMQCWNELQEAYKQILLSEKSIASATENFRLNSEYYNAGTVALSDLLDAQTILQQSRDQHTDACTAYQVKLSNYLRATGR